jgi:hypothetical protein
LPSCVWHGIEAIAQHNKNKKSFYCKKECDGRRKTKDEKSLLYKIRVLLSSFSIALCVKRKWDCLPIGEAAAIVVGLIKNVAS